jgi:hypothetical protein
MGAGCPLEAGEKTLKMINVFVVDKGKRVTELVE